MAAVSADENAALLDVGERVVWATRTPLATPGGTVEGSVFGGSFEQVDDAAVMPAAMADCGSGKYQDLVGAAGASDLSQLE